MKRHVLEASALALALLLNMAACGGRSPQNQPAESLGDFETESTQTDGIQRMHDYNYTDTLRAGGKIFEYTVHREADSSLPTVCDDDGMTYADNRYDITLRRAGQVCFQRSFTKQDFASCLSAEFRQKAILDGMMCDKSLPGICFAVSVTLPQTDMVEPLLLRIDLNGGISIERDGRSENDFEAEAAGV